MNINLRASTVEIAGRTYPACAAICPVHEKHPEAMEGDRLLAGPWCNSPEHRVTTLLGEWQIMIPCENGVIAVIDKRNDTGYEIALYSVACGEDQFNEQSMWLPHFVCLVQGQLLPRPQDTVILPGPWDWIGADAPGPWDWIGADADWVVEHIDRISVMPFVQPPGPKMKLIPLAEAKRIHDEFVREHADHSH